MAALPLEERIAVLEAEVKQLKQYIKYNATPSFPPDQPIEGAVADNQATEAPGTLLKPATSDDWLDKVIGSISDEEAFLEALEFGRAYRLADRPVDDTVEEP